MTIEKLEEFASNGDKHLTGLDVTTGFPRADKPERPWFNKLFGDITGKINEVVDNIDELPPFDGGVLADTFVVVDGNQSLRDLNQKTSRKYTDVLSMVADTKLKVGQFTETLGYQESGDGGENRYIIEETGTQVADGGAFIELSNGLIAKALFPNGELHIKQFGAHPTLSINDVITNATRVAKEKKLRFIFDGDFNITAPCTIDVTGLDVHFSAELTTLNTSEVGVLLEAASTQATGILSVVCGEGQVTTRRQEVGVLINNASSAVCGTIKAKGCIRDGIRIDSSLRGNSNMLSLNYAHSVFCGWRYLSTVASVSAKVINFTSAISPYVKVGDFVRDGGAGNAMYEIRAINSPTQITVDINADAFVNTAVFLVGAGFVTQGQDSNVMNIGTIDTTDCFVGAKFNNQHGNQYGAIHVGGGADIGVIIGSATIRGGAVDQYTWGGHIGYLYVEDNVGLIGVLQASMKVRNWSISSLSYGLKVSVLHPKINFAHLIAIGVDAPSNRAQVAELRVTRNPDINVGTDILGVSGLTYSAFGNEYLLLCKKEIQGAKVDLHLFATDGAARNKISSDFTSVNVTIVQGETGVDNYTASISGTSLGKYSNNFAKLVFVSYKGSTWFALALSSSAHHYNIKGTFSDESQLAFVRGIDLDNLTTQPVDTGKVYHNFGLTQIIGKSLILSSPNNTRYKVSVTDAGALLVEPTSL